MVQLFPPVVLASTSPRRRELIRLLRLSVETISVDVDETPRPNESPEDLVRRLCRGKAEEGAAARPDALIIAADTVVALESAPGETAILGKPQDPEDAARMLRLLRNRAHLVYSGLATCLGDHEIVQVVRTTVWMRDYSDAEIEAYVATGDPLDKAAAYAIQHAAFHPVARIDGCYANVMGLPLCHLYHALAEYFTPPEPEIECYRHPDVDCTVPKLLANPKS